MNTFASLGFTEMFSHLSHVEESVGEESIPNYKLRRYFDPTV